jgi:hypothetical protein
MESAGKLTNLWLILGLLLFSSCSHFYYVPVAQNVPLLKEKAELRLNGMLGTEGETSSKQGQASYAINDFLGAMINYSSVKGGDVYEGNWGKGEIIELGTGWFKRIGGKGVFEVYGGYGVISQYHEYYYELATSEIKMNHIFIQPAIGYTSRAFDIAFSSKLLRLHTSEIDTQLNTSSSYYPFLAYSDLALLNENPTSFLLEPALTLRAGWKFIKLQVQLAGSINLSQGSLMPYDNGTVTVGLHFSIPTRKKVVADPGVTNSN